jgi:hypothetical protein
MRTRALVALLCVVLIAPGCAGFQITPTKAINLSVAVELSLKDLQDRTRAVCRPEVQRPNPIIGECNDASIAAGFTTAKFRNVSALLAKTFDFVKDVLGPALDRWQPGEPPPAALHQFALFAADLFDFIGTLVNTPQTALIFTTASALASTIATLTKKIGGDPLPFVTAFLEAHPQ